MTAVLAFDPAIKTNSELIGRVAQLGYLNNDMTILDTTYGLGNFWGYWTPDRLIGADIEPGKARDLCASFLSLPFPDSTIDAVVFDPPYRLNGTERIYVAGDRYGVAGKQRWQDRMAMILDGAVECARVTKRDGVLLVKCQDQVVSGRVVWQTKQVAAALAGTMRLVDELHLSSYRPQPSGRSQVHARRNYSTLQIYKKERV